MEGTEPGKQVRRQRQGACLSREGELLRGWGHSRQEERQQRGRNKEQRQ